MEAASKAAQYKASIPEANTRALIAALTGENAPASFRAQNIQNLGILGRIWQDENVKDVQSKVANAMAEIDRQHLSIQESTRLKQIVWQDAMATYGGKHPADALGQPFFSAFNPGLGLVTTQGGVLPNQSVRAQQAIDASMPISTATNKNGSVPLPFTPSLIEQPLGASSIGGSQLGVPPSLIGGSPLGVTPTNMPNPFSSVPPAAGPTIEAAKGLPPIRQPQPGEPDYVAPELKKQVEIEQAAKNASDIDRQRKDLIAKINDEQAEVSSILSGNLSYQNPLPNAYVDYLSSSSMNAPAKRSATERNEEISKHRKLIADYQKQLKYLGQ